ncbi:MAG: hypothetical protein OXC55_08855 [Chloroflexi bacterium]|nr:hypothetical protein [Chloroflexota bacterium]
MQNMDEGPTKKPYSDTDLEDFLQTRALAKSNATNERYRRAYRSEIAERVRKRTGYDRNLAARIQGYQRRVYPEAIKLPERLTEDPSYRSTIYELRQRGHIEFPPGGSITKNMAGELCGVNINLVALTAKGYAAIQRDRINRIKVGAAIITAVSTGIVAGLALIQVISSP